MNPAELEEPSRTAVVTGGSGGIGLACAEVLVACGYDVVLTARTEGPLRAAAKRIGARWVAADAADPGGFARVVEAVERVDLLVHAAGTLAGTFVRKERLEDFDAVIRANLRSTLVTVQGVLPKMRAGGRIVLISSSSSESGMKGRSAYSASKAGMNAFAESLAAELERDGINVNVLIPAPVETPMLQDVAFEMHAIQPEDVAGVVGFLDALDPRVVVPRISMRAAAEGPLAARTVIPPKARA
ncbi:SDR family oxidoreductase [Actinocorallia longicatena]|uniref:Ketoreductase domain-containing protein n=1 Tax=Actinocorallia longicatena TaxID=111803 RepID=A0ABP6QDU9_9ACTN